MENSTFKPYKNESDNLQLGDLTIENRFDRVSIYGSIDLTKDKQGLDHARFLKKILDLTLTELENGDLPDQVAITEPEIVKNPFA